MQTNNLSENKNNRKTSSGARTAGSSSAFFIYPAIDLKAGQVVRLSQGDPNQAKIYGLEPAGIAQRWIDQGAQWLHLVNLDGALDQPDQVNKSALQEIAHTSKTANPPVMLQLGGGLRTLDDCQAALDMGIDRMILGTMAVENPAQVEQAIVRWGVSRIALAIDARNGYVQTHGWKTSSNNPAESVIKLAEWFTGIGGQLAIYTDITRDGIRTGLNIVASRELVQQSGLAIIASGGVASLDDLRAARIAGLSGVIIGRALYEGVFKLKEAILC